MNAISPRHPVAPFRLFLAVTALLLAGSAASAAETPDFPESVTVKEVRLRLVGTGSFSWMFFQLYHGAYYQDASRLQEPPLADVARRLTLHYHRKITARQFRKSGNGFLEKNFSEQTLAPLRDKIDRLNEAYQTVRKGDRYSLTYLPGYGTTLALNGEPRVTVPGAEFARVYFSIWLGDEPVKASFREDLLNQ